MKNPLLNFGLSLLISAAAGQAAEFCSNQITGTLTFNNASSAVLDLLDAPGNEGMSNLFLYADSVPEGRSTVSPVQPAASLTSSSYAVTVDVDCTDPGGIPYRLSPVATVGNGRQYYFFNATTSAPVVANVAGPVVNFDECVGVVRLRFFESGGAPATVSKGRATCYRTGDLSQSAILFTIADGSGEQRIYLEGGQEHRLEITLHRGTDQYTDRQVHYVATNVLAVCDDIVDVDIFFPPAEALAQIVGTVDMRREFEWSVPATDPELAPDFTTVIANYGPFLNERWDALPGDNLFLSSSGAFTLANVVPSTVDPGSPGYAVSAVMLFRSDRRVQYFRTPGLGAGSNAPVAVTPGATVNLGSVFEIDPGYLRGQVLLQGPAESPGHPSLLRGLLHAGDDDFDSDGIPDVAGTYGVYWSSVGYEGVDRRAPGASYTASLGYGYGDFDGDYHAPSSAYRGDYELALGGLQGERTIWRPSFLNVTLSSGTVTNESDYYDNNYSIMDHTTRELEVVPGQPVTNDLAYCFSEVRVRFTSPTAAFYAPQIRFFTASFNGTNFLGQPDNYTINAGIASGTPRQQADATNRGEVVMYLPQGNYTLLPAVIPAEATGGYTGLASLEVPVGCGQVIELEPCLQLTLDPPVCGNGEVHLTGSVRSCTNVASITYTLDGGPAQTVCSGCGIDPAFAFDVPLGVQCQDYSLKVTATDVAGGESSVTTTVHYDVLPPIIQCPANLTVGACDTNGAIVNFTVTATDNCPRPLSLVCNPPSGSHFPVGVTTVNCIAADECGNTAECNFTVTVAGSGLSIAHAVMISWACGGTLQSADDAGGPWTDLPGVTSPYFTPTSEQKKFYRVRP